VPTFGQTTIGGNFDGGYPADAKQGTKYTLNEIALVSKLTGYFGSNNKAMRRILYADSAGTPTALLGVTAETIAVQDTWTDFVFPTPIPLNPSDYWLCFWVPTAGSGGTTGGWPAYDAGGNRAGKTDPYSSTLNPSDPFGTPTLTDAIIYSFNGTSIASSETITLGFRAGGPAGPY
jgi:hypothetical protein